MMFTCSAERGANCIITRPANTKHHLAIDSYVHIPVVTLLDLYVIEWPSYSYSRDAWSLLESATNIHVQLYTHTISYI